MPWLEASVSRRKFSLETKKALPLWEYECNQHSVTAKDVAGQLCIESSHKVRGSTELPHC